MFVFKWLADELDDKTKNELNALLAKHAFEDVEIPKEWQEQAQRIMGEKFEVILKMRVKLTKE